MSPALTQKPHQFKKPEDYKKPTLTEVFFRLKPMPASLVQYAVERVTVEDDRVVERKVITERDILPITMSKIEDAIVAQVRK